MRWNNTHTTCKCYSQLNHFAGTVENVGILSRPQKTFFINRLVQDSTGSFLSTFYAPDIKTMNDQTPEFAVFRYCAGDPTVATIVWTKSLCNGHLKFAAVFE